jgi:hypothetical protein
LREEALKNNYSMPSGLEKMMMKRKGSGVRPKEAAQPQKKKRKTHGQRRSEEGGGGIG